MKIEEDKVMHMGVCAVVSLVIAIIVYAVGGELLPSVVAGFLGAMACGIGKEYGDSKSPGNKWDNADVLADGVGALVGVAIGCLILLII